MRKIRAAGVVRLMIALGTLGAISMPASAEKIPCSTIRIVVPYSAGGPSDTGARLVAKPLGELLGVSVIVENRGGAGGLTGTELVAREPADGCTLLLGAVGPLVYIPSERKVTYAPITDFIPLGLIWQSPLALVVNPKLGVKTVQEFVAYAKKHPNAVSISSAGVGTNTHMASELFKREAHIQLLHVPYKGTSAAMPDLLSGQINSTFSDVAYMTPFVREGKLAALAVTTSERSELLPDVPTMAEAGLPGVVTENWYGLLVKANAPPAVVAKLKEALAKAVVTGDFRKSLAIQGAVVRTPGPDAFSALIRSETKRWVPIIKDAGIKF